ncbi:MAG: hypothetical protein WCY19_01160 [Candidatus Gastranaerophilaceae bacterium]
MSGFNYNSFKEAINGVEQENYSKLMDDVEKVKVFIEKALTLCLESNANTARTNYPGVEL